MSKLSTLNSQLSTVLLACVAGCGVSQAEYNVRVTEVEKCQAELGQTQNQLGASHAREDQLRKEREERDDDIARLRADAAKLANNLQATQHEMDALRRAHAQAEQRNELYRTLVTRLRDAIGAGTLAVEVRKGKMLVKLGDTILFDPGQATLKSDGQRALRQVAQALKEIAERDFLVAGHTDNRPIKNSPYASNWELSTARAVTVVRFLQSEGVDPRRLAAAGYSEFDALADNETSESRALNRRIEVVVMPRIDELPQIDINEPAAPAPSPTTEPGAPAAKATSSPPPPAPPTP
ncbi:MAG: OmpA/MotB domain protein [bacterium]|nr:OmpA/MotB domain protein [bacterium]